MFDIEKSEGWQRGIYTQGLKHGLERTFYGKYPDITSLQRVAFYCNDTVTGSKNLL